PALWLAPEWSGEGRRASRLLAAPLVQLGKNPPSVYNRAPDVKVSREESLAEELHAYARPTSSVHHTASSPACRLGTSRTACDQPTTHSPTCADSPGHYRRSDQHAGGSPSRP